MVPNRRGRSVERRLDVACWRADAVSAQGHDVGRAKMEVGRPCHRRSAVSHRVIRLQPDATRVDQPRRSPMTRPAPTTLTTPTSIDEFDELDDDVRPIGRILSRREVLALMGAGGTAAFL